MFFSLVLSPTFSVIFFFCSTSLVLLPQISLLLTALVHPRCKALRVPERKMKKNDRFFVAFFTSRFSRCKQVFLCATRLNFVCHFFFTFPFLLVSFRFPPPFSLQFPVFFTIFFLKFAFHFLVRWNYCFEWRLIVSKDNAGSSTAAGQVEELEEEREERKGSGSLLVSACTGPTKQFKSWFCSIFKDFRS